MADGMTRRRFVQATMAVAAAGMTAGRSYAANERIRLGVIGVANRGSQLIKCLSPHEDAEIVALCDVDSRPLEKQAAVLGGKPELFRDYRKMLERKDIDAVVVATPDHWHALLSVDACDAGKDVYVEKPLSMTIHEGRRMVEAARRNKRVVQVGLHRRSGQIFAQLADFIKQDGIGKVTVAHCYRITNMFPNGIGKSKPSDPPKELDWDMWLGPRAFRPYQDNIAPYKFRWWQEYSSQIGNWGVHYFDVIRWALGEEAPASISAHGGRFAVDDDRTIPDTMQVTYEFASGRLLMFGQYEASGNRPLPKGDEVEFRGTQGTLYSTDDGYEIVPERGGQFQDESPRMKEEKVKASERGDMTTLHLRNFLDCIKSREKPHADVEEGHKSTVFAHLGTIALASKSRNEWDAKAERITNNDAANDLLQYAYREPWKLA
jgi:predicted dehydrogenase